MKTFEVGQRVQVVKKLDRTWAGWARESMPGLTGVIVAHSEHSQKYLVRFDKPIPPDRPGRVAITHFHFEAKWLQEVSK